MKKKMATVLMAGIMAAAVFTGCGQKQADSAANKGPAEVSQTTEEEMRGVQESASEAVTEAGGNEDQTGSTETSKYTELIDAENAVLSEHMDIWTKVFDMVDKEEASEKMEEGQKYLDFLNEAVDKAKDTLTDEEKKIIDDDLKKIEELEKQMSVLDSGGAADKKASSDAKVETVSKQGEFADFSGNDLDGNAIDKTMLKGNKATVLNFWFNGCSACVSEMPDLQKFNEKLKEKGAELIGVNVDSESEKNREESKKILSSQGADYRNIQITGGDKAMSFMEGMMAFPTTILIDSQGNVIGDPICGTVTEDILNDLLGQIDNLESSSEDHAEQLQ